MRTLVFIGSALLSMACSRPNPAFDMGDDEGVDDKGGSASNSGSVTAGGPTTGAVTAEGTGSSATMGEGETEMATDTALPTDVGDEVSCVPNAPGRRLDIRIYDYLSGDCAEPMIANSLLDLELVDGTDDEFVARLCPSGCSLSCKTVRQGAPQVRIVVPPELRDDFEFAGCIDFFAQVDANDDCRVDYFFAWLGALDPKEGRGPVDYVGVTEDLEGEVLLPGLIPPHEFVEVDLCGSDCLGKGDAVGEWALEFPSGDFFLHDTQGDAVLISDGGPVGYHVLNLQSYVSEDCQPHRAWFAQRLYR